MLGFWGLTILDNVDEWKFNLRNYLGEGVEG